MFNKSFSAVLIAIGLAGAWSQAHATPIGQMNSVLEMIDIDNQIALMNERKRLADALKKDEDSTPATTSPAPAAHIVTSETDGEADTPPADTVELVGIYGLEHQLYADVLINNTRIRFKQGAARAERQGASFPYRLKFIAPPCASLVKAGEAISVCLGDKG